MCLGIFWRSAGLGCGGRGSRGSWLFLLEMGVDWGCIDDSMVWNSGWAVMESGLRNSCVVRLDLGGYEGREGEESVRSEEESQVRGMTKYPNSWVGIWEAQTVSVIHGKKYC